MLHGSVNGGYMNVVWMTPKNAKCALVLIPCQCIKEYV